MAEKEFGPIVVTIWDPSKLLELSYKEAVPDVATYNPASLIFKTPLLYA